MAKGRLPRSDTTANLGFETKRWLAADKLRNNVDAAECQHVVLGLILLFVCGSGPAHAGFVQSEKFVESHGGKLGDISIYGQESNATTRRLAVMNLALRGIEADFGPPAGAGPNTFRRDLHPDLRAGTATRVSAKPKPRSHYAGLLRSERQLLANPPFNDSDWFRKEDDVRWQFGVPPKGNANFAWAEHFIHHLAQQEMAGLVLVNCIMSSDLFGEGDIRRALIEADLVDCMVDLPGQLFCRTQIPVCLWFLAKNKAADAKRGLAFPRQSGSILKAQSTTLATVSKSKQSPCTNEKETVSHSHYCRRADRSSRLPLFETKRDERRAHAGSHHIHALPRHIAVLLWLEKGILP